MNSFLKGCSKNFKDFFDWSIHYLEKHNKKVVIVNAKCVREDGNKYGGWCDGDEIVVARKMPKFEETYVHEFSHMNQAVENSPLWDVGDKFWRQLQRKTLQISSWEEVIKIISLERDCERRSILHSKQWDLFDNESYAQNANLYLYYYQFVFLKRQWMPSPTIYHPFLVNEMPKKLMPLSSFKSINMPLMMLFNECLDKKGKHYGKLVKKV
jgi:hypothetical protein